MSESTMAGAGVSASIGPANEFRRRKFSAEPGVHYNRVTDAWQYLIGDDLHVGYFEDRDDNLLEATQALTRLMADSAQLGTDCEVLDVGCGT